MDSTTTKLDIQQLRKAIPRHCFVPSDFRSTRYVLFDLILAGSLATWAWTTIPLVENPLLRFGAWMLYGYTQGLVFTGIWILAHECGHQALFSTKTVCDAVGFVLHGLLLVPFFSWKYTHARHHRYTNHVGKDTAFVPRRDGEEQSSWSGALEWVGVAEDTPVYAIGSVLLHQVLGWPGYLLFYVSGSPGEESKDGGSWMVPKSHFVPFGGLFSASEQPYVLLSTIGVAAVAFSLYTLALRIGWASVFFLYGIPWLWVNNWLIAFTYLHHNDANVPHFDSSAWTFIDGATSTVDRPFGFVGRHVFHGIVDWHVVHHLFPRIPFYHAEEATKAIIPVLGERYHRNETPFWLAFWRTFRSCRLVEPDKHQTGVLRWKS